MVGCPFTAFILKKMRRCARLELVVTRDRQGVTMTRGFAKRCVCTIMMGMVVCCIVFMVSPLVVSAQETPKTGSVKEDAKGPTIRLKGNVVVPADELWSAMGVNPTATITPRLAQRVRQRLKNHYWKQGYTLAHVDSALEDGQLVLTVFEGQLEKILIFSRSNLEKFLINLTLDLPGKVFNTNRLTEMTKTVEKRYGLKNVEWKLVKKSGYNERKATVQLTDVTGGYFFNDKASPYELHILIARKSGGRRGGPGFGARMMLPKGFNPYAYYKDYDLLFDNDEWLSRMEFGLYYTTKINRPSPTITSPHKGWENVDPLLTYLGMDGYYYLPQWWDFLRIGPEVSLGLTSRGRADLPLDLYRDFSTQAVLNLDFQVTHFLRVIPGFGFDYHTIFGINEVPEEFLTADQNIFHLVPYQEWRWFPRLMLEFNTGKELFRLDRGHRATLEYLYRHGSTGNHYHLFKGEWKNTWDLGYDEITPRVRGVGTLGDMPFYDNLPLSSYAFKASTSHYVENALELSLEYRLSLVRDVFKISVFHDAALFRRLYQRSDGQGGADQVDTNRTVAFAHAFGPGLHVLIWDLWQFDIYGAFSLDYSEQKLDKMLAFSPFFTLYQVY